MNKVTIALATVSAISTTAAIVLGSKLKKADEVLKRADKAYDKLYEEYSNDVRDYEKLSANYSRYINILHRIDREAYEAVLDELRKNTEAEETEEA